MRLIVHRFQNKMSRACLDISFNRVLLTKIYFAKETLYYICPIEFWLHWNLCTINLILALYVKITFTCLLYPSNNKKRVIIRKKYKITNTYLIRFIYFYLSLPITLHYSSYESLLSLIFFYLTSCIQIYNLSCLPNMCTIQILNRHVTSRFWKLKA